MSLLSTASHQEVARVGAILSTSDWPGSLKAVLGGGLGGDAESGRSPRMSPELSYGRHSGPPPHTARAAAVMLLMFRRAGRWHLPITKRPAALTRHGGQISLPGGGVEPGEGTAEAALRELVEELGIGPPVHILGQLPERYVFASDYVVTPLLGWTDADPVWVPDAREVERVVELPLDVLFDPRALGRILIQRGPLSFHAPCYEFQGDHIWGATAVILAELADAIHWMASAA